MNTLWHTVGWQEMRDELQQDGFPSVSYSPILTPTRLGASRRQGRRHPAQGLAHSRRTGKTEEHVADERGACRTRGGQGWASLSPESSSRMTARGQPTASVGSSGWCLAAPWVRDRRVCLWRGGKWTGRQLRGGWSPRQAGPRRKPAGLNCGSEGRKSFPAPRLLGGPPPGSLQQKAS